MGAVRGRHLVRVGSCAQCLFSKIENGKKWKEVRGRERELTVTVSGCNIWWSTVFYVHGLIQNVLCIHLFLLLLLIFRSMWIFRVNTLFLQKTKRYRNRDNEISPKMVCFFRKAITPTIVATLKWLAGNRAQPHLKQWGPSAWDQCLGQVQPNFSSVIVSFVTFHRLLRSFKNISPPLLNK